FSNVGGGTYNLSIAIGAVIENAIGGSGADTFVANAAANAINGMGGVDTVDYHTSTNRVVINLSTGYAAGGHAQGDTLANIENVVGSNFSNDILTGNAGANELYGIQGADVLAGLAGPD